MASSLLLCGERSSVAPAPAQLVGAPVHPQGHHLDSLPRTDRWSASQFAQLDRDHVQKAGVPRHPGPAPLPPALEAGAALPQTLGSEPPTGPPRSPMGPPTPPLLSRPASRPVPQALRRPPHTRITDVSSALPTPVASVYLPPSLPPPAPWHRNGSPHGAARALDPRQLTR